MSIITTNDQYYKDIANAIRNKNGTITQYKPEEMANAINTISSGGGIKSTKVQKLFILSETYTSADDIFRLMNNGLPDMTSEELYSSSPPDVELTQPDGSYFNIGAYTTRETRKTNSGYHIVCAISFVIWEVEEVNTHTEYTTNFYRIQMPFDYYTLDSFLIYSPNITYNDSSGSIYHGSGYRFRRDTYTYYSSYNYSPRICYDYDIYIEPMEIYYENMGALIAKKVHVLRIYMPSDFNYDPYTNSSGLYIKVPTITEYVIG